MIAAIKICAVPWLELPSVVVTPPACASEEASFPSPAATGCASRVLCAPCTPRRAPLQHVVANHSGRPQGVYRPSHSLIRAFRILLVVDLAGRRGLSAVCG